MALSSSLARSSGEHPVPDLLSQIGIKLVDALEDGFLGGGVGKLQHVEQGLELVPARTEGFFGVGVAATRRSKLSSTWRRISGVAGLMVAMRKATSPCRPAGRRAMSSMA